MEEKCIVIAIQLFFMEESVCFNVVLKIKTYTFK